MPLSFGDHYYNRDGRHQAHHEGPFGYTSKGRPATIQERREMLIHKAYSGREAYHADYTAFEVKDSLATTMAEHCPTWGDALWGGNKEREEREAMLAKWWNAVRYYDRYHIDMRIAALGDDKVQQLCPQTGTATNENGTIFHAYTPQQLRHAGHPHAPYDHAREIMRLNVIKYPGHRILPSLFKRASVSLGTMGGMIAKPLVDGISARAPLYAADGITILSAGQHYPVEPVIGLPLTVNFQLSADSELEDDDLALHIKGNGGSPSIEIATPPVSSDTIEFTTLVVIGGSQTYNVKVKDLKVGVSVAKYVPPAAE